MSDDYKLISFYVKSLFASIPLQLALQSTETAIQQSTIELPLPTENIMDLLNLSNEQNPNPNPNPKPYTHYYSDYTLHKAPLRPSQGPYSPTTSV